MSADEDKSSMVSSIQKFDVDSLLGKKPNHEASPRLQKRDDLTVACFFLPKARSTLSSMIAMENLTILVFMWQVPEKMKDASSVKPDKVPVLGGIEKKEDFAEAAATLLAESAVLAASGGLDKAIEQLFAMEKKCRLSNDITSLKSVVTGMCQMCFDAKNWSKLNFTVTIIAKRHQQSRHAISAVVALVRGKVELWM